MVEIQTNPELIFEPTIDQIKALELAAFSKLEISQETHSFGIHFTTDEEIQSLNAKYRGYDKPTDVLSFEADIFDPEQKLTYMGDIIISVPTMKKQATIAEHTDETEMLLLITHGLLHLAGYDHVTEEQREEMWLIQAEILGTIGFFPNKLPED